MQEYSDEELMSLAMNNDAVAFEELFHRYKRRLFAFFYRLQPDVEEAKDFSQEVILKLWRERARYTPKGRFSTYLFRIAKNHFLDKYRQQKYRAKLQPISMNEAEINPEKQSLMTNPHNAAVAKEIRSVICLAIARLPEMHRLVYVFSEEQRMSYQEIADILGCPVGTVSSRKVEAHKKLRELLKPLKRELLKDGS
jgi:RNA polymerase sigma-70 factor (ECF subfamily)